MEGEGFTHGQSQGYMPPSGLGNTGNGRLGELMRG